VYGWTFGLFAVGTFLAAVFGVRLILAKVDPQRRDDD
jgi:hypothetical protein